MTMASFARGAEPTASVYAVLEVGTPAHTRLKEEIDAYQAIADSVRDRLKAAREVMQIPDFKEFYLETKNGKVHNLSIFIKGLSMTIRDLKERFPMVEGRGSRDGSLRFRDKSGPQKQFAELMAGCPPMPDIRDICRKAFDLQNNGQLDAILGYPGFERLDDGRYLMKLREGWPTWLSAVEAKGGRILTKPESLRLMADVEEAKAKKPAPVS